LSVIIPVCNGARFLAQAVASVQCQNPAPREIIVVDDGSDDRTPEILKALQGVHGVRQPRQGPGAARNHGLRLATGSLLAFLDADDRWTPDKTALQLGLMKNHPDIDIVVGHAQRAVVADWDAEGRAYRYEEIGPPVFYLHLGSALFRRQAFDRVGGFEERLPMGEDVDWYLRAKELGIRMRFHSEVVQYYLRHDRNVTRERDETNRYLVRALKRSLDRRRAAGGGGTLRDWSEETRWLRGEEQP
jgi:glycosyltransferase involved in cell wall biosynthesis